MSVSVCVLVAALGLLIAMASPAFGIGQAASGELLFYPCTICHPVGEGAGALPNDFEGHQIELVGHDVLGEGVQACIVCHDDPARDPGKLKLVDGSFADVGGDVSGVCFTCHSSKYREWEAGVHGRNQPTCTSSGCHDPHSPAWIYGDPLLPFTGTGFQTRVVSDRQPFTPLAGPPVAPPVYTPFWLAVATALGAVVSAGLISFMVRGRSAR
ncbi:MAG: hypothetical protein IBX63_08050 [Coriobacteriia bacterium]|nr:hypothetical protein [Coriobacteriia bacterium]